MRRPIRIWVGLVGFWLGLAAPAGATHIPTHNCPPDSVRVGTTCVDTYEASVWEISPPLTPAKRTAIRRIREGTVTLANLTAVGAIQRGVASDDYDAAGCPDTGNGCVNVYAVSIPGVTPSRFITWFQAAAAARNSFKRLPTNAEWQTAALGTPDPGVAPGPEDCNTNSPGPDTTGARANCVSNAGMFDMVGNVDEWVADWWPQLTVCPGWGTFSDDLMCQSSTGVGPEALARGGDFSRGAFAGPFMTHTGVPSGINDTLGFRGAR